MLTFERIGCKVIQLCFVIFLGPHIYRLNYSRRESNCNFCKFTLSILFRTNRSPTFKQGLRLCRDSTGECTVSSLLKTNVEVGELLIRLSILTYSTDCILLKMSKHSSHTNHPLSVSSVLAG